MSKKFTSTLLIAILLSATSLEAQVGIGTNTPLARLHVADSNVIFSELGDITATPPDLPVLAAGRYFLWHPGRAAVRMGSFEAVYLTAANIGLYSVAMGLNTNASGRYSTAMGGGPSASGDYSTAMGGGTRASGDFSTAMGYRTQASGFANTTMGYETQASGDYSAAMGGGTLASGDYSTAMGRGTQARGLYSTAMGHLTIASGLYSAAMGDGTKATGDASTALGTSTTAQSFGSVVLGRFNVITGSQLDWVASDPLLVVGNGSSTASLSNAFTLLKNGNLTIAGTLTQNSDARLKTNILPLSMALSKVLALNGYQYNWNTHYADNDEMHTGLLAQEVQKLMPELVREDAGGTLSVNYTGMVPYLIESVKAQQQEIEKQNDAIETLKKEIETLKTLIHAEKK